MTPLTLLRMTGVDICLKDDGVLVRARAGVSLESAELYAYANADELMAELRVESAYPNLFKALADADRLRLAILGLEAADPCLRRAIPNLKRAAEIADGKIAIAAQGAGLPKPPSGDSLAARAAVMTALLICRASDVGISV